MDRQWMDRAVWLTRPGSRSSGHGRGGRWRRALGLLFSAWLLCACVGGAELVPSPTADLTPATEPVSLTIACPGDLAPALRAASALYQRDRAEVEIVVLSRANALASQALQMGDADVVVLTWLPPTLPDEAWVRPVARDGLAMVVNPQNGLPGVTMTQLQDLFQGRIEDWALWGGLPGAPQLISRETASGDYAFFQAWVMRDTRVSLNALMAPSTEAVLSFVAEEPLSIGYVSSAWLDGRVRALAVNDMPPSAEAIAAGLYPMTRTHFVVTMTEPDGAARNFVQWLLAEPGQAALKAHGYVAAPE
jgi:phosphate transport system substrate-binding protein